MRDLIISIGGLHPATVERTVSTSWQTFAQKLAARPPESEDKRSRGWYCPAEFSPAYRDSKNFVARHALTFDYDAIDCFDLDDIQNTYRDLAYVLYTTASHTEEKPRIRVVFPLSRPATFDEFCAVTRKIGARFDIEKLARESDVPAQMMFLPTVKPSGVFWSRVNDGSWVDVEQVLGEYAVWSDRSEWPRRLQGDTAVHTAGVCARVSDKRGIVGDFCRAFTVPDAIARFDLPYVQGSTEDRYTYTLGSSPDGLRIYDDGTKGHSEHNTDPAHGQHNAFDLVRLHQFGSMDEPVPLDGGITEHPSHKAMCEFAASLPEIIAIRSSEFENLDDTEPLPAAEKAQLERFRVQKAAEFATTTPLEWHVRNVLPKAELAVTFGESGAGKSFWILDLCTSVERGEPWRGLPVIKGRVVYVCAEGASGLRQRLRAYSKKFGVPLEVMPDVIADAPNMRQPEDAAAIAHAILAERGADIIIIDTLSAVSMGGNENSGEDVGKVLEHCKFLHRKTGALIILIHHSGKDASKGARGWSGLRAAADAEIEITRDGDFRAARITKMKDGADGACYPFQLRTVVLEMDEHGEEITSLVVEHTEDTKTPKKRRPSGHWCKVVYAAAGNLGSSGKPVYVEVLADHAVELVPRDVSKKRDTRKQLASRAIQTLVEQGFLFVQPNDCVSVVAAVEGSSEEWLGESNAV